MILGTFFTITEGDVATMTSYVGDLVSDLTPLLLPIIGVMVGLFVFWAIVRALKG